LPFNPDKAVELLTLSSNAGAPTAIAFLAALKMMGLFVCKDLDSAVPMLLRAAKAGSADAQYYLGWYYQHFEGSSSKAVRRYRLAANLGHKGAKEYFYSNRHGSGPHSLSGAYLGNYDTNPTERSYQMVQRANKGESQALCDVGYAYLNGICFPYDSRLGLLLLHASAHAGNAMAQYYLGVHFLQFGNSTAGNEKAEYWLGKSFVQEYPPAQEMLVDYAFLMPGAKSIRSTRGFNIFKINDRTHTRYTEDGFDFFGYDRDGYDMDGYDTFLFNREGTHKVTQDKYDSMGFDKDGFHRDTGTQFDLEGLDRHGFRDDGTHSITGQYVDEQGYNQDGRDYEGFDRQGYDKEGFDRFGIGPTGYSKRGFDHFGIHRDTGTQLDPNGFDARGKRQEENDAQHLKEAKNMAAAEIRRKEEEAVFQQWMESNRPVAEDYMKKTGLPCFSYRMKKDDSSNATQQDIQVIPGMNERPSDLNMVADLIALHIEASSFYKGITHPIDSYSIQQRVVLFPTGEEIPAKRIQSITKTIAHTIFNEVFKERPECVPFPISYVTKRGTSYERVVSFHALSSFGMGSATFHCLAVNPMYPKRKPEDLFLTLDLLSGLIYACEDSRVFPNKKNEKILSSWFATLKDLKESILRRITMDTSSFFFGIPEHGMAFSDIKQITKLKSKENTVIQAGYGGQIKTSSFNYNYFIVVPWIEYTLLKKDYSIQLKSQGQEYLFLPARLSDAVNDTDVVRFKGALKNLSTGTFTACTLRWQTGSSSFRDGNLFYTIKNDHTTQLHAQKLKDIVNLFFQLTGPDKYNKYNSSIKSSIIDSLI